MNTKDTCSANYTSSVSSIIGIEALLGRLSTKVLIIHAILWLLAEVPAKWDY